MLKKRVGQLAALPDLKVKKMTKAIIKKFNETEAKIDALFAKNVKTVYAPFFKAVADREAAFAMFKGEKGATEAKRQYDIENGFRNANGDYLVKNGLATISQAKFFMGHSVDQLMSLSGSTLGTAYKNASIAKNADKPKRGKVTNKKPAADNGKPQNIEEMAKAIIEKLGRNDAEKLSIAIADLLDAGAGADKKAA